MLTYKQKRKANPKGSHEYEVLATSFSYPRHTTRVAGPPIFSLTLYGQCT